MKFAGRKPLSGDVNLVPLINIVFLLLIFFMVSSTFITPDEFNIDLPESEQVQVSQLQPIVVLIGVDGGLALNNRELDLDDLELSLAAALAIDPDAEVLIRADAEATTADVVNVLRGARAVGIERVAMATREAVR